MKDTHMTLALLIMITFAMLWSKGRLQAVFEAVFGK